MKKEDVQAIIDEVKKEMQWDALTAAVFEILRMGLIAGGSWIFTEGLEIVVELITKQSIDPTIKMLIIGIVTAFAKAADRGIHQYGKLTKNDNLVTGITGF